MKVFNTLTNKKEEFVPIKQGEVSIYVDQQFIIMHILAMLDHSLFLIFSEEHLNILAIR